MFATPALSDEEAGRHFLKSSRGLMVPSTRYLVVAIFTSTVITPATALAMYMDQQVGSGASRGLTFCLLNLLPCLQLLGEGVGESSGLSFPAATASSTQSQEAETFCSIATYCETDRAICVTRALLVVATGTLSRQFSVDFDLHTLLYHSHEFCERTAWYAGHRTRAQVEKRLN